MRKYLRFSKGTKGGVITRHLFYKYGSETGKICLLPRNYKGAIPKEREVWLSEVVEQTDKKFDLVIPVEGPFLGVVSFKEEKGWESTWGWIYEVLGDPDYQEDVGYNAATGNTPLYLSVWRHLPSGIIEEGKRRLAEKRQKQQAESDRAEAEREARVNAIEARFEHELVYKHVKTQYLADNGISISTEYQYTCIAYLAENFSDDELQKVADLVVRYEK